MKPNEALNLIDSALSQLALNRADHAKLMEAVRVLAEALNPKPAE